MAKKQISEVKIKITGTGIKTVVKDVDKLLAGMEGVSMAAKEMNASLAEGGRADAVLSRIAASTERSEKEFQQLHKTSVGTLKLLEAQLQQTAFATEDARDNAKGLGSALKGTETRTRGLNNRLKDTNRQGTNTARTFSSMARAGGGLTIIYAAIAANVFALSEAFRIMKEAADVTRLSEASDIMSNQLGVSIKSTAEVLYETTDAAVSMQEALKLAAASAAYGFDTAQMEKLAVVAKRASVVLGVDMQDALRRVTRGIAKQEVELLDELGLTIRMNEAFSKYAATHGLAANSLNTFQRQQAFTNEVIKKSEDGLSAVDDAMASTAWERFGAEVSTSANEILQAAANTDTLVESLGWAEKKMKEMREGPAKGTSLDWATSTGASVIADLTGIVTNDNPFYSSNAGLGVSFKPGGASAQDVITTPGAGQVAKLEEGDLRGAIAAQVTLAGELEAATKKLATIKPFSIFNPEILNEEYAAHTVLLQGLIELRNKATDTTGLSRGEVTQANEALKELSAMGKTFTNDMDTYGNEVFGVADVTIQQQIDSINAAAARAKEASKGQFSDKELYDKAKTSMEELAGRAQNIANYQKIGLEARSVELSIMQHGLTAEKEKEALAAVVLNDSERRLAILEAENASEVKILEVTKEKLKAQGILNKIAEDRFKDTASEASAQRDFLFRREDEVTKSEESLATAERTLARAKERNDLSEVYLKNLEKEVLEKERSLVLSKEAAALENLKTTNRSITSAVAFDNRNQSPVMQAEMALSVAEENLANAEANNAATDKYKESLRDIVLLRERELTTSKETLATDERRIAMEMANTAAGSIGTLDAGMGQTAQGVVDATAAWEKLGDAAESSMSKLQAASQIAAAGLSAMNGLVSSAASMVTSGIDAQIAAVKNSGATQEEQDKKIYKLQKKKIKEQEKYAKASILLSTAMAVANSLATPIVPLNFVLAGMAAAAGAMAYQQASNTASAQLNNLAASKGGASDQVTSITVGSASTPKTDVSQSASGDERGQMLGNRGVYGRASAGSMRANTPYITSETGRELVIPKTDSRVFNSTETENILSGGKSNTFAPVINVNALDSQSLEDRMPEVLKMLQEQAEQQGFVIG